MCLLLVVCSLLYWTLMSPILLCLVFHTSLRIVYRSYSSLFCCIHLLPVKS
ncbi:hypothetical protein HETIRDRAFT_331423 [Heterobasidion irregulare TC 32-1]|uniref:Uncharacterized protein n=1 Tax=Heterobasidion irregulare (strain TC 32-1) TaxID=747525 RepID=W4JPY9_HETIT|nr:uncharacterized protein HETIRDRAFT_331423 [Heterobasidion irregulare TC 32-1]ETW75598.1 hypothetical protein HETIRDRAFT_331423 [Heterobasidion irregulare TC 32-1]